MNYLLSTAHSACAHSLAPSLHNRKLVSRMCVLSFNRAIALHLVFLHALVLINTLAELDRLVDLAGTHATLTVASLCFPSLARQLLRLVMGPENAVAPPSTHGGNPATINKTLGGLPYRTLPIPTGPTAQRLPESISGEAGPHVIGRMPIAYRGKDERVERVLIDYCTSSLNTCNKIVGKTQLFQVSS